jgi:2-methylcitrate dehydratase PrpD
MGEERSITEKLAGFANGVVYDRLPQEVTQRSKMAVLDSFANMLACGVQFEPEILAKVIDQFGPSNESTVYGLFQKRSCADAALINGLMGRILDLDDGHLAGRGHPGALLVPTVFSLGEKAQKSGKEVLAALVVGYEAYTRMGKTMNPMHRDRGFDTTGTIGIFAAALAASRLLGLSIEQMVWSMGIAGSMAGGLNEYLSDGSMPKNLHPGMAARNGILSAQLAQAGISGPKTVLEGKRGFIQALVGKVDVEMITVDLGKSYGIMETYFKRHACMRRIHAAVDCACYLAGEKKIDPKQIAKIIVHTSSFIMELNNPNPETIVAAQGSVPFCVATAFLFGQVGLAEFIPENLKNPSLLTLLKKVEVRVDPEYEKVWRENPQAPWSATVEVVMDSGQRESHSVEYPMGEPQNPIAPSELARKYDGMAAVLPSDQRALLQERIEKLETIQNLADLYKGIGKS